MRCQATIIDAPDAGGARLVSASELTRGFSFVARTAFKFQTALWRGSFRI
jgi:hypothetical protein